MPCQAFSACQKYLSKLTLGDLRVRRGNECRLRMEVNARNFPCNIYVQAPKPVLKLFRPPQRHRADPSVKAIRWAEASRPEWRADRTAILDCQAISKSFYYTPCLLPRYAQRYDFVQRARALPRSNHRSTKTVKITNHRFGS